MNIPAENKKSNQVVVRQESVMYSAPLPEASQFERYDAVVKGAGDRILGMAERQAKHRQYIEKWSIVGDQLRSFAGLLFGFFVALAGISGTVYLILNDKVLGGSILGIGTLGSIVTSLIYGSQHKTQEAEKRKQELEQ